MARSPLFLRLCKGPATEAVRAESERGSRRVLCKSLQTGYHISCLSEWQDHSPKSETWLSFDPCHKPHLSLSRAELC